MDSGAPLGVASVASLVLSPFWPALGLAGCVKIFHVVKSAMGR